MPSRGDAFMADVPRTAAPAAAFTTTLDAALADAERRNLRRVRRTVERFPERPGEIRGAVPDSTDVVVEGRRLVNFCGNDYLALSRHPAVATALREAALRWGVGSGASHLVTGHGIEHERLEEELAAAFAVMAATREGDLLDASADAPLI